MQLRYVGTMLGGILGGALAMFACGGDDPADPTPTEDSGADVAIDRQRVDQSNPPEDAGPDTWCTQQPAESTNFCDDFDDPAWGAGAKTGPWESSRSPGVVLTTSDAYKTSGDHGLLARLDEGEDTDGGRKWSELVKGLTTLDKAKFFRVELDIVVPECVGWQTTGDGGVEAGADLEDAEAPDAEIPDAEIPDADLPDAEEDGGGPEPPPPPMAVRLLALDFGNGHVLSLGALDDQSLVVAEQSIGDAGESVTATTLPFQLSAGFQHAVIAITPGSGKDPTSVEVAFGDAADIDSGATPAIKWDLTSNEIAGPVKLMLGLRHVGDVRKCVMYSDNVIVSQRSGAS